MTKFYFRSFRFLLIAFLRNLCVGSPQIRTPTNSKTKDDRRTKHCTVIVRHISNKNQQLDFRIFIVLLSVAIVLFGARS